MSDGNPVQEIKSPPQLGEPASRTLRNGRVFALWLLAGTCVGIVATLLILRARIADPLPEITPADFYAAREQWEKNELPNYDIEIAVTGTQSATYRVQVREGRAVAAWRNDQPLMQERTFSTWSVRGMFGTISRDIDRVERLAAAKAEPNTPRLTLRGEFDERTGYPQRYRRIEWGSPVEVSWKVTRFEVQSADSSPRQTSAR
jgi:hypothetical protein